MSDYGFYQRPSHPDFEQDPDSILDYPFEWGPELEGDSIETSTFVLPDGMTLVNQTLNGSLAVAYVSGPQCGIVYRLTNRITTGDGRSIDKTVRILGREQ